MRFKAVLLILYEHNDLVYSTHGVLPEAFINQLSHFRTIFMSVDQIMMLASRLIGMP